MTSVRDRPVPLHLDTSVADAALLHRRGQHVDDLAFGHLASFLSLPRSLMRSGRSARFEARATAFDAMPKGHARGMSRRCAASRSAMIGRASRRRLVRSMTVSPFASTGSGPVPRSDVMSQRSRRFGSAPASSASRRRASSPVLDKIVKRREGLGGEGRGSCKHVHVGVLAICFADRGDTAGSGPRLPGCPGKPAAGSAGDPVSSGTATDPDPVMTASGAGAMSWAGAPSARGDGCRGWTGQGRACPPWPLR